MKLLAITDHFVRQEHYEKCMEMFPGYELTTVYFGKEDRVYLRDVFHHIERGGPDAFPIPEEIYTEIEDAEVLITHICPIPGKLLRRAKKLRAILVNRGGLENVDVATATELGIPVINNPAHNANAVAEFTVAMMICEGRNIARSHLSVVTGKWRENYVNFGNIWELRGKTIGLIGFSTIGRLVAEKLSAFGCKIIATDIKYDPEDEFIKKYNIEMVDLPTLMKRSDYVSLHARANCCILTREMLNLMKPTAIFINTARAHMVDYDALYDLLKDGKILGAAIDVFPNEPLTIEDRFVALDNVTLTTHRAGDTVNSYSDSPEMRLTDYALYLAGKKPRFFVNPQVGMDK